jgi:RimJ/RimL family protein N-acetyltransferase
VISVIHPDNDRSRRVAARLGEEFERDAIVGGREVMIYGRDLP